MPPPKVSHHRELHDLAFFAQLMTEPSSGMISAVWVGARCV